MDKFRGAKDRHFLALVCFLGKIDDLATVPEIYIVPSIDINGPTYTAPGGRETVELRIIRRTGDKYRGTEAWKQLL